MNNGYVSKMLRMLLPMMLSITIPLIMLDAPIWLMTIIDLIILSPLLFTSASLAVFIPYAYYIIRPILYIWALVATILGVQDFVAIAFYIIMVLQLPKMVINFLGSVLMLYSAITSKGGHK